MWEYIIAAIIIIIAAICVAVAAKRRAKKKERLEIIKEKTRVLGEMCELCKADNHDYFNDFFNMYGITPISDELGNRRFSYDDFTIYDLMGFYTKICAERLKDNALQTKTDTDRKD